MVEEAAATAERQIVIELIRKLQLLIARRQRLSESPVVVLITAAGASDKVLAIRKHEVRRETGTEPVLHAGDHRMISAVARIRGVIDASKLRVSQIIPPVLQAHLHQASLLETFNQPHPLLYFTR